jgi:excisionase family DNA binding protein
VAERPREDGIVTTGIELQTNSGNVPQDSERVSEVGDLEALLTVKDVATLLQVSTSWVYEHTRRRGGSRSVQLRHVKIGKYVRFERRAVREYLDRRRRTM